MTRLNKITQSPLVAIPVVILLLMIDILSTDAHERYSFKMALFALIFIVGIFNLIHTYRFDRESFMKKLLACCLGVAGLVVYAVYFRA